MKTNKKILVTVAVVSLTVLLAPVARADWDPGDGHKMHYPQLPDLDPTGLDVLANWPYSGDTALSGKVLADDWQCSASGPVTDIHIWGSWLNDNLPQEPTGQPNAGAVGFFLSIHEDIPAGTGGINYSRPGPRIWDDIFLPGDPRMSWRLYEDQLIEGFYDPNQDLIIGTDTEVYQYNFFIDPRQAFPQEEGTIYWLNVIAVPEDGQAIWGWKTSLDHWNDDAVWGDVLGYFDVEPLAWSELRYPEGHPLEGQSIDLAFVITPEPATLIVLALGLVPMLLVTKRRRTV